MLLPGNASSSITRAASVLRRGGLVAFPTETVYGLGAAARDAEAVARLYALKGRPAHHPVIVHLAGIEQLHRWVRETSPGARQLARRFWPGPLTLVLPRAADVPDQLTGGQDSVGLRVPEHPVALALLRAFGEGIAAPSANRFGRVSPTTAAHVLAEFGEEVDVVLDGGPCRVGLESTIVDLSGERPRLLRPGAIAAAEIERFLGEPLAPASPEAPRAPGGLPAHYAPATPLRLLAEDRLEMALAVLEREGRRAGVLARAPEPSGSYAAHWRQMPADAVRYAHDLYASLRELDARGLDQLLVGLPPEAPEWGAVNDRLSRAAARDANPGLESCP